MNGVLSALDLAIEDAGTDFGRARLHFAKAITLGALERHADEVIAAARDAFELLVGDDDEYARLAIAEGRLEIARQLVQRGRQSGEYTPAEQALRDVASFYQQDEDPLVRAVAIRAEGMRFFPLFELGRSDAIPGAWASLRERFGGDEQCEIRRALAGAGRRAALQLLRAGRLSEVLAICEDVITCYRSDTDARTRAEVVAVLQYRLAALGRAPRRWAERWAATMDVIHFIGADPEPEVVATYRHIAPGLWGRLMLFAGHDQDHRHSG